MTESDDRSKPAKPSKLTLREVQQAFEPLAAQFTPLLNLKQAAALAHCTPGTLKKKVSEGFFSDCVSRGKPLLFWRDKFVLAVMSKPKPRREDRAMASTGGDQ